MRSNQSDNIDKVTFIEYTKLPGIINDRLHVMFSENHNLNKDGRNGGSPSASPSSPLSPSQTKKGLETKKKEEFVTEK